MTLRDLIALIETAADLSDKVGDMLVAVQHEAHEAESFALSLGAESETHQLVSRATTMVAVALGKNRTTGKAIQDIADTYKKVKL